MAFIPVPGVIETRIRGTLDGQQVENTMYWTDLTLPGEPRVGLCASAVRDCLTLYWLAHLPAAYEAREVYAIDLSSATGSTATAPFPSGSNGERAGEALPNNCSFVISFRTALRGRSFRGRIYWPGLDASSVTGNEVTETYAGQILLAVGATRSALFLDDFQHTVVSRYSGGAPRAVGLPSIVTEILYVDRFVDSQRRRLPGRGA